MPTRRFLGAEDGHVAVITALTLTVLLGFTALGVDTAALYREKAALQAASDLAAMSAMGAPEAAATRAETARARNRPDAALSALAQGRYLRNPALAPEDRFTPLAAGAPGVNAVTVALDRDAPLHFARIFTDQPSVALTASAMASRTGAASFTLTSHIARLDPAALNDALSTVTGLQVALSLGDMQVLAGAEVSAGALLAELARLLDLSPRNPAEMLEADVTLQALVQALRGLAPDAEDALAPLSAVSGSLTLPVASLIAGIDPGLGLTATDFAAEVQVSALDVLRAVIAATIGGQSIHLDTAATVPGVTALETRLRVGEPPARSGWIALGEEGVQLHRAAARLSLNLDLAPTLLGNLGAGVTATDLSVPLYVELAGATATLDTLSCAEDDPLAARFLTAPTPLHPLNGASLAALYLGTLPADAPLPLDPATLGFARILDLSIVIELPLLPDVTLGGLSVEARSDLAVGASQVETVSFSRAQVAAGDRVRGFGSGDVLGTAVAGLLDPANTEIRLRTQPGTVIPALAVPVIDSVMALLPARLLAGLTAPLDAVLDETLATAGLSVGEGELTLTGYHCELIRLVQ